MQPFPPPVHLTIYDATTSTQRPNLMASGIRHYAKPMFLKPDLSKSLKLQLAEELSPLISDFGFTVIGASPIE